MSINRIGIDQLNVSRSSHGGYRAEVLSAGSLESRKIITIVARPRMHVYITYIYIYIGNLTSNQ